MFDPHHRHALPGRGELEQRAGDGLFALGQRRACRVPLGLADDGWTAEGHRSSFLFAAAAVAGGPLNTRGAYSSNWVRPSKVRLPIMSSATSG